MSDPRPRRATSFPEELLSGYLDEALTQQEEQQVRVHLEQSPEARALLGEITALRQAARSTPFVPAEDRQWSEAARTPASRLARRLGFSLIALWLLGGLAVALWQGSWASMTWWEGALVATAVGGPLLLFLSVLADRIKDARTDRYRRVLK